MKGWFLFIPKKAQKLSLSIPFPFFPPPCKTQQSWNIHECDEPPWEGGGGCQQCNEWRSILSLGQARAFTPRCSPGDTEPRVVARVSQEGYWRSAQGEEGGSRTGHSLPPTSATHACPKRRWQWPISSPLPKRSKRFGDRWRISFEEIHPTSWGERKRWRYSIHVVYSLCCNELVDTLGYFFR